MTPCVGSGDKLLVWKSWPCKLSTLGFEHGSPEPKRGWHAGSMGLAGFSGVVVQSMSLGSSRTALHMPAE